MTTDPWSTVPPHMRSIVSVYCNSDNAADRERAMALCAQYGLDYEATRRGILDAMNARSRAERERWAKEREAAQAL